MENTIDSTMLLLPNHFTVKSKYSVGALIFVDYLGQT